MVRFSETSKQIRLLLRTFLHPQRAYQWFCDNIYRGSSVSCRHCHRHMSVINIGGIPNRFRCKRCRKSKSFFSGTVFENMKAKFHNILLVILLIYLDVDQQHICLLSNTSRDTVRKFQRLARLVEYDRLKESNIRLGGEGKTVQLDEAIIRKRKFNKGRKKEQIWVFGAVEDDPTPQRKLFLTIVKNRKASTLIPLIQKYILPGTRIITDEWKGYIPLSQLGYSHLTVNHKCQFLDPKTGANTNRIEGLWAHIRRSFPRSGVRKNYLQQFIIRFMVNSMNRISFSEFLWRITFFDDEDDSESLSFVTDASESSSESSIEESTEESTESVPSLGQECESSEVDLIGWGTGESASEWEP